MELTSGSRIDRFVIHQLLGAGGMARVYRVENTRLGSMHALKVLHIPTPSIIERLLQEGRLQSTLRHPNIVSVTDIIDIDGVPGLVMEYVDGPSLRQLLASHRLTLPQVDVLAAGLLSGIGAAHRAGLVHRDLKPGNILLQVNHDQLIPKITDFGLAKAIFGDTPGDIHTRTGAMMGSPAYMAPEQSTNAGAVDQRADVFAMGCVLYEMVTGKRAFEGADTWELIGRIRAGQFTPPRQHVPDLPVEMENAILGALVSDPDQRIPSIAALSATWGRHVVTLDAVEWEAELLSVRSPAPSIAPASASVGQTMTTGSALFGDFQAPSSGASFLPTAGSPAPAPVAPKRWPAVVMGMVGTGIVGLAGLALWSRPAPAPQVLTAASVPVVFDDANSQRQFMESWSVFLQGDRTGAIRRLSSLTERYPEEPLPWLVLSYVLMRDGQTESSIKLSREAIRLGRDREGPLASLLAGTDAQQHTGDLHPPEMVAHWQAWPDDLLGLMLRADYCYSAGAEACEEATRALLTAAPNAAMTHRIVTEAWDEVGDAARQQAALSHGLTVVSEDPELLLMLSTSQLQRGDLSQARQTITRTMAADSRSLPPRILRAQLAIIEHDAETLGALRAELTGAAQPLASRISFYRATSSTLRGLGRAAEADAELEQAEALARAEGTPMDTLHILSDRIVMAESVKDMERFLVLSEEAANLTAQSPEIPPGSRTRQAAYFQSAQGRAAVARGDLASAKAALARMDAAEDTSMSSRDSLARQIAIAEQDLETIRTTDQNFWQSECLQKVLMGDAMWRAGSAVEARPFLEAVLDASCLAHTHQRTATVLAHVSLAELMRAEGEDAQTHIAAARALWPNPDPEIPLNQRLLALESGVD